MIRCTQTKTASKQKHAKMKFTSLAVMAVISNVGCVITARGVNAFKTKKAKKAKPGKGTKNAKKTKSAKTTPPPGPVDDNDVMSVESCNFPTGTFMYSNGCDGNSFAVIFDCEGQYCTYAERMLVVTTNNDEETSLGFRDDLYSCMLAGTFRFPAMADRNEDGSCRLGYSNGIALDEGACGQQYNIKIDVVGNEELMIRFSNDGGKTYYNEDEPRQAKPFLLAGGRRLDLISDLTSGWNFFLDTIDTVVENIIDTVAASFVNLVLNFAKETYTIAEKALNCQNRPNSDFAEVIISISGNCACAASTLASDLVDLLLGDTSVFATLMMNEASKDCISWLSSGCNYLDSKEYEPSSSHELQDGCVRIHNTLCNLCFCSMNLLKFLSHIIQNLTHTCIKRKMTPTLLHGPIAHPSTIQTPFILQLYQQDG